MQGLTLDEITSEHFLIEKPFLQDSEHLLSEWYDAAALFLDPNSYKNRDEFVEGVNSCFTSLINHSTRSDTHLFRAKAGIYESSRRSAGKPNSEETRAFLLLEQDFASLGIGDYGLFYKQDDRTASEKIKLFSPLFFLRRILTADDYLESEAYAHAIIRAEIFAAAIKSFPPDKGTNIYNYISDAIRFQNISKSLSSLESYLAKRDSVYFNNISDFIVGNLLASQGYAFLSLEHPAIAHPKRRRSERAWMTIDEFLERKSISFTSDSAYEIKFVPELDVLPSASQILSNLDGIPIAIPGAGTIFSGGIRTTENNGAVVRITGKSGTGKTTLALALCTSLAPLGTTTFYLSCEEEEEDLIDRIYSVTPPFIANTRKFSAPRSGPQDNSPTKWFTAYHLNEHGSSTNLESVELFIDSVLENFRKGDIRPTQKRPPGIVPFVIVLDGVHEVVSASDDPAEAIEQLHSLVTRFRELNALVVLLSADIDSPAFRSLDYLVDVVIKLDSLDQTSGAFEKLRAFRLEKTRRQFSNTGNHRYHISKQGGVKIYPNMPSILESFKKSKWQEPDTSKYFDFLGGINSSAKPEMQRPWLKIFQKSHTLITGKGSSGKASFALRLLTSPIRRDALKADMFAEATANSYLSRRRILIISFLYPQSYYTKLIKTLRRGKYPDRLGMSPTPKITYEVMAFYPGFLQPEVLLGKISDELHRGFVDGMPYDSILIDGLHNVFLQFPGLESNTLIWPVMSEIFRRCGLTVAITHAHFNVIGMDQDQHLASEVRSMANRSVPLLQNLVNSADYYLDVSPFETPVESSGDEQSLSLVSEHAVISVATALGQPIPAFPRKVWNRTSMIVGSDGEFGFNL